MAHFFYYLLYSFLFLVSLLPLKVLYLISDFLSFILMRVFGYRKGVIYTNVARSFPELRYKEIDEIVKKFRKNLIDIFIESIWTISAPLKKVKRRIKFDERSIEIVNQLMKRNRGLIITMGHQANWEMLSPFCLLADGENKFDFTNDRVVSLYKKIENKPVDLIMNKIRSKFGLGLVETVKFGKFVINHKDDQLVYVFIADQAPHGGERFAKKMFNQRTYLISGPENVAVKYDIPVVFMSIRKHKRGKYELFFDAVCEKPTESEEGYITGRFADLLEEAVNLDKSNWLWSHKRWKREPKNMDKIKDI